jgi:hypothetical protein
MNHTIKGIIIVAAIASMLVVGATMIPLAQNTYASSHRHSEFKSQDDILNQQDGTYRSPGSESSNVAIQESGKGNSPTAYSDQSSNIQQNQPTLQQQNPQSNKDKDTKFPITLNVLPNQRITNTNVNPNRNTASSNSSSASDASNDNTINNTALARQRQAEASCAVALTCPEGSTTVTPPTTAGTVTGSGTAENTNPNNRLTCPNGSALSATITFDASETTGGVVSGTWTISDARNAAGTSFGVKSGTFSGGDISRNSYHLTGVENVDEACSQFGGGVVPNPVTISGQCGTRVAIEFLANQLPQNPPGFPPFRESGTFTGNVNCVVS